MRVKLKTCERRGLGPAGLSESSHHFIGGKLSKAAVRPSRDDRKRSAFGFAGRSAITSIGRSSVSDGSFFKNANPVGRGGYWATFVKVPAIFFDPNSVPDRSSLK
jgi:hypothetical protein